MQWTTSTRSCCRCVGCIPLPHQQHCYHIKQQYCAHCWPKHTPQQSMAVSGHTSCSPWRSSGLAVFRKGSQGTTSGSWKGAHRVDARDGAVSLVAYPIRLTQHWDSDTYFAITDGPRDQSNFGFLQRVVLDEVSKLILNLPNSRKIGERYAHAHVRIFRFRPKYLGQLFCIQSPFYVHAKY